MRRCASANRWCAAPTPWPPSCTASAASWWPGCTARRRRPRWRRMCCGWAACIPPTTSGAEIPILGTNAHWDAGGELFVAEGDESDGTLALYHPEHAIVLEHRGRASRLLRGPRRHRARLPPIPLPDTRARFLLRGRFRGRAHLLRASRRASVTASGPAPSIASTISTRKTSSRISALCAMASLAWAPSRSTCRAGTMSPTPLGVIALATELGVPFPKIAEALESFRGARRRFEILVSLRSLHGRR